MKRILSIVLLACLCSACCHRESIYHQYLYFQDYSWKQSDTLIFCVDAEPHLAEKCQESQALYQIAIDEHSLKAYPYQHLWVAIRSTSDSLSLIDTLDLLQKENLSIDCPFRLSADKFPFSVDFYHLMQDEALPNLHRIGLEIKLL